MRLRWWTRVAPVRRTSSSTAQPVAWQPPLCWRTRCHYSDRHLLSSLHPFFLSSSVFPWQTFTVSLPLQESVGLLRCRRPLSRVLAFSHPEARARRCQSSLIPTEDVIASRSLPAIRRMVCWNCPQRGGSRQGKPSYRFGYGVSASFAILGLRRFRRRFLSSA